MFQSRLARSAAEQDLRIRRLEVHLVPAKKRRLGSSRRHEAKQCESVVPRRITIHSQPMQPDPSSRHPVGGFPGDENAILCKPLTELARRKLSDLPPGEEKPGNHDRPGRSQPSRAKSTNHDGGAPVAANEAGDRSCFFHATTTRDRTKTYRMSILHSEKAARIAGHGGSLSSRLPSGIATRCRRL